MPFILSAMQMEAIIWWDVCSALLPVINGGPRRFLERRTSQQSRRLSRSLVRITYSSCHTWWASVPHTTIQMQEAYSSACPWTPQEQIWPRLYWRELLSHFVILWRLQRVLELKLSVPRSVAVVQRARCGSRLLQMLWILRLTFWKWKRDHPLAVLCWQQ